MTEIKFAILCSATLAILCIAFEIWAYSITGV